MIDIGWVSDPEGHVSRIHTERDDASPATFWLTADPGSGTGKSAASNAEDVVPVKPSRKVYGGTAFILSQISLPHVGAVINWACTGSGATGRSHRPSTVWFGYFTLSWLDSGSATCCGVPASLALTSRRV